MSIILDLLFPKKKKFNIRTGSLAHEDFLYCIETYMTKNSIEWSDLNCDLSMLMHLFESYKDEEIQQIFKKIDDTLPDIQLPY